MTRARILVLSGLVTGALASFVPAVESDTQSRIGRLFSSPEQRRELDRIRDEPAPAEVTAPVLHRISPEALPLPERDPPALAATLNGVVVRSDGHRLAWIDGTEAAVGGATPAGIRVEADRVRGSPLGVRLSAGRTSAVVEPGQSVDENGEVRAAYEGRPAVSPRPPASARYAMPGGVR